MATEVISQIPDYHVYNCVILTCTAFYTQSIAGQYNIYSWIYFSKLLDKNALKICTLKQCSWHIMDLDPHSQKCLSHDLINNIIYKNASAVTSV